MARTRSKRAKPSDHGATAQKGDWRHVALVTVLLGAVLGTLVLGAVLRTTPEDPALVEQTVIDVGSSAASPLLPPATELPAESAIADPVVRQPDPPGDDVAGRVSHDLRRLAARRSGWMLQLMAACDEANVQRLIDGVGGDDRLHVLPARLDDRPCFRVCWGPFSTRDAAEAGAADLPSSLGSLPGSPAPKPVADLLP